MQKARALELRDFADEIAERFSQPHREYNINNETFTVHEIIPLSESTGVVLFVKNTGKYALAFFYWLRTTWGQKNTNSHQSHWRYFMVTTDHLLGMASVADIYAKVERHNWLPNFQGK